MPASKIVDETEVLRWFEEGRTYQWMVDEYLRKYNIETAVSMWGNFRKRRGLDRRYNRDDELIPWFIAPQHRMNYALTMLRAEGRRRAGVELPARMQSRLDHWLAELKEADAVVHYDPETDEGFHYVERRSLDKDLIRRPQRATSPRKRAD